MGDRKIVQWIECLPHMRPYLGLIHCIPKGCPATNPPGVFPEWKATSNPWAACSPKTKMFKSKIKIHLLMCALYTVEFLCDLSRKYSQEKLAKWSKLLRDYSLLNDSSISFLGKANSHIFLTFPAYFLSVTQWQF